MITPKPATVFDLFNGHPERWTKGANARADDNWKCSPTNPDAIRWSVQGAILFIYGMGSYESDAASVAMWQKIPAVTTIKWNNSPSTTFDIMLAKVKEAGI